tara:strand:- start:182 stop:658 length:477 start_codon:yes stop_codon:yes gene_type:complete
MLMDRMALAFWTFFLAGVSDFLDGLLARLLKSRTAIGAYLDPLADKTLMVAVFITLAVKGIVPLWLVIAVVSRDVLIISGTLLILLFEKNFAVSPHIISKINTAVQIALVAFLLGVGALGLSYDSVYVHFFFYLTGLTTILSGGVYVHFWIQKMGARV